MRRPAFRFDLDRCTGCQACELACVIENRLEPEGSWRGLSRFNPQALPTAPRFHLSLACNHCDKAPCAAACPAAAFRRDPATGALLLDGSACIGCGYCAWACPWAAPKLDDRSRTMGKCNLCSPRLERGLAPACVAICPTGALGQDELAALEAAGASGSVPGFPPSAADPAIRFLPLRAGSEGPSLEGEGGGPGPPEPPDRDGRRLSLRREWPLLLFTWAGPFLVAMKLDTMAICRFDRPLPILLGGLAAMALSLAHLGRPPRAWRALLGLRESWLSREIAAFGLFVMLAGALPLLMPPTLPLPLSLAAAAAGFTALYAMDRVYDVALPRRGLGGMHSADVLPTALLYALAMRGWTWVVLAMLLLKLAIWAARYLGEGRLGFDAPAALRLAFGVLAGGWLLSGADPAGVAALGLLAVGELLDRVAFYRELRLPSPTRDLARALSERR